MSVLISIKQQTVIESEESKKKKQNKTKHQPKMGE